MAITLNSRWLEKGKHWNQMIFMVPSNLYGAYFMIHLNLAHICPCTPLIWSLTHQTDFSKHLQTCHLTRNSLAIWALCLGLASLQLPGGDQESTHQVATCLIIGPWLWDAEALTRLFFAFYPFPGCLYYLCLPRFQLTTLINTWGAVYVPPSL